MFGFLLLGRGLNYLFDFCFVHIHPNTNLPFSISCPNIFYLFPKLEMWDTSTMTSSSSFLLLLRFFFPPVCDIVSHTHRVQRRAEQSFSREPHRIQSRLSFPPVWKRVFRYPIIGKEVIVLQSIIKRLQLSTTSFSILFDKNVTFLLIFPYDCDFCI